MSDEPTIDLRRPEPIHPGASPLLPAHLVDLFLHPRRFFTGQVAIGKAPYALFVAWCYGASETLGRIDQALLRQDVGASSPVRGVLGLDIAASWSAFWVFLAVSGAFSAVVIWWLGGWWYAIRLRWSGSVQPDRRMARLVLVYSGFVIALPSIVACLLYTASFPSYGAAFASADFGPLVLVVFPFWSVLTSYSGVRAVFGLEGRAVRLWFLILPMCVYALSYVMIVLGLLLLA
jgi:hypothetical protein